MAFFVCLFFNWRRLPILILTDLGELCAFFEFSRKSTLLSRCQLDVVPNRQLQCRVVNLFLLTGCSSEQPVSGDVTLLDRCCHTSGRTVTYNAIACNSLTVQKLCESRGRHPGLSVPMRLMVLWTQGNIEPCLGIGHSFSLKCQPTSEDMKLYIIIRQQSSGAV